MKTDNYDQRVRITKRMIRDAFLKLLAQKTVREITVRELCLEAHINRGTFYTHYKDIYDLKEQIENELLEEFVQTVTVTLAAVKDLHSDTEICLKIFSLLRDNYELCIVLFNNGLNAEIIDKFAARGRDISARFYREFYPEVPVSKIERYYLFISTGCIAVLRQWLLSGMKESIEDLSAEVSLIMTKGLGYLEHN